MVMAKKKDNSSKISSFFSKDINVCIQLPCHPNAICTKKYENSTCECKRNYVGNGFSVNQFMMKV